MTNPRNFRGGCSTLPILAALSHSQCSMCCCSSENKDYLHSWLVLCFGLGFFLVGLLVSGGFAFCFFDTSCNVFPKHYGFHFKTHMYYKTNWNKNLGGEGDGKVKGRHLHKRTIFAILKYLPFAANNQR